MGRAMRALFPLVIVLIAAMVGIGAVGGPALLAPVVGLAGAASSWMVWRRWRRGRRPAAANRPPSRAETCSWLKRNLTRARKAHLAQRVDRAFQKAERAEEAVRTPGALRRPRDIEARLDAFDLSANNLVVCVQYQGTVEEALADLERVATSLDRSLAA